MRRRSGAVRARPAVPRPATGNRCLARHGRLRLFQIKLITRVFIFVSQRLSSTSRHSERSHQAHLAGASVQTFNLQPSTFNLPTFNLQPSTFPPSTFNLPTFNLITFNVQRSTFQPSTFPPSTFNLQPSHLQPSHLQPSTLNSRLTPPPSAPSLRCNPSASRDRGCVR
jgi:hypothetical protein